MTNERVSFADCVDYFAAALDPQAEDRLERAAFESPEGAQLLVSAGGLVAAIRAEAALHALHPNVLNEWMVARLRASGAVVQQAQFDGRRIDVSLQPDADVLIAPIPDLFPAFESVDLEFDQPTGTFVDADVPVAASGEIVLACSRSHFDGWEGPLTTTLRVRTRDGALLGEYDLNMRIET